MPNCSQLMTHDPVFCLASDTVDRAAQLMRQEDVGSLPVIESHQNKKLLGIITDRDIALKVVADGRDARSTRAQEVMTRNPVTCQRRQRSSGGTGCNGWPIRCGAFPLWMTKTRLSALFLKAMLPPALASPQGLPNSSRKFQSLESKSLTAGRLL